MVIARQWLCQHFSTSATSFERRNGYKSSNVGTVRGFVFYAVRAEATTIEIAARAIGDLDRCTPVRELHVVFKIRYVYDYINKLCTTQAAAILNHVNPNVRGVAHGEAMHMMYED
jgi:hypothetical protein